jgi:chromosome segregation ATPase
MTPIYTVHLEGEEKIRSFRRGLDRVIAQGYSEHHARTREIEDLRRAVERTRHRRDVARDAVRVYRDQVAGTSAAQLADLQDKADRLDVQVREEQNEYEMALEEDEALQKQLDGAQWLRDRCATCVERLNAAVFENVFHFIEPALP